MTDWIDEQGFRANVGIILLNGNKRVFFGKRVGNRGWQFPQGGIQPGEEVVSAMYRELEEETGLKSEHVEIIAETGDWLRYKLPKRYMRLNSKPLCVGQKQRWFLLRFLGENKDIALTTHDEPEFESFRWVNYWEPARRVIYFKRPVYRKALKTLAPNVFPKD